MNEKLRLEYLDAMGIQVWQPRIGIREPHHEPRETLNGEVLKNHCNEVLSTDQAAAQKSCNVAEDNRWADLEKRVSTCTACELHATRTQTVFGTGSHSAKWMIIGEAPGASEDQQGKPFVGPAGRLLTEMLRAAGLERDEVFIANILKCRPPGNRDPRPTEVEACDRFIKQQVTMLNPEIILATGRIAAQNLLKTDAPLGRLRGRVHRYGEIPVVVIYHPAYLLRSPLEKRKAWDDLQLALKTVGPVKNSP